MSGRVRNLSRDFRIEIVIDSILVFGRAQLSKHKEKRGEKKKRKKINNVNANKFHLLVTNLLTKQFLKKKNKNSLHVKISMRKIYQINVTALEIV